MPLDTRSISFTVRLKFCEYNSVNTSSTCHTSGLTLKRNVYELGIKGSLLGEIFWKNCIIWYRLNLLYDLFLRLIYAQIFLFVSTTQPVTQSGDIWAR